MTETTMDDYLDGSTDAGQTRIEGTDDLLLSVIEDQAADFEHGWRELIQNGLDSPTSTTVELYWTEDETIVHDNGDGVDLTDEYGQQLLTNLGESSKGDDDDRSIGEFGIGKGQPIAKAMTAMISGEQALIFDIKGLGLDVITVCTSELTTVARKIDPEFGDVIQLALDEHGRDGFTVAMSHYESETPNYNYKWDRYEKNVIQRFQYAEIATATKVIVNGERISDEEVTQADKYNTNDVVTADPLNRAHIAVVAAGEDNIDVYSNGVYVTDVEGRGLKGNIVTEGNLDLNFARNDISSGCDRFNAIQDRLTEIRIELFSEMPDGQLSTEARDFIADALVGNARVELDDSFDDTEVFALADGDYASLNDIRDKDTVVESGAHKDTADKLGQMGMTVLDSSDQSSAKLLAALEDEDEDVVEVDEILDADNKAEAMGMHTKHEEQDRHDLRPIQRKKLAVAKAIADRISTRTSYQRVVKYGESDVAKAWTDGQTTIWITDSSAPSNAYMQYSWQLFRQLVHEFAHTTDTRDTEPDHGSFYNRQYRELCDDHHDVLTEVQNQIQEEGIQSFTDRVLSTHTIS